ncbi:MAG: nitroreductase family protein [Candidatus Omnitrophota bacterium]
MTIEQLIKDRRSIRRYKSKNPSPKDIRKILGSGAWAPSGLNNQPWKFKVIDDRQQLDDLSGYTKYANIIKSAPAAICIFLDKELLYNRDKDIMAIGACIQNMLLQAQELNIGTCWLGEILNRHQEVEQFLGVPEGLELMAVITCGYSDKEKKPGSRKKLDSLLVS